MESCGIPPPLVRLHVDCRLYNGPLFVALSLAALHGLLVALCATNECILFRLAKTAVTAAAVVTPVRCQAVATKTSTARCSIVFSQRRPRYMSTSNGDITMHQSGICFDNIALENSNCCLISQFESFEMISVDERQLLLQFFWMAMSARYVEYPLRYTVQTISKNLS